MARNPLLPIALSLLLVSCGSGSPEPAEDPPLAGADIGADFTLTGEDGKPVSWHDFDGQYRTIYFGYAFCPDVCPTDNQRAMAGLRMFEKKYPSRGRKIQPIFVSVDPERDTPAVLREFTANFHPRLLGMTGDIETLEKVTHDFASTFSRGEDQPGGGYLVNHTNLTFLFGPDGQPIATLPTDLGPEAVEEELEKWVH